MLCVCMYVVYAVCVRAIKKKEAEQQHLSVRHHLLCLDKLTKNYKYMNARIIRVVQTLVIFF